MAISATSWILFTNNFGNLFFFLTTIGEHCSALVPEKENRKKSSVSSIKFSDVSHGCKNCYYYLEEEEEEEGQKESNNDFCQLQ